MSAEDDLGFDAVLHRLAGYCQTRRGAEGATQMLPAATIAEAEERLSATCELMWLAREKDTTVSMAGVSDVGSALDRATKGGVLADDELIDVARSAASIGRVLRLLTSFADDTPAVTAVCANMVDRADLYTGILSSYGDDGRLADHASPELGGLRRSVRRLLSELEARVGSLVESHADHLQDSYYTQRDGRYVVPVRSSSRSRVDGIVHGTSQSGQTVFIEPAGVVDAGNKLRLAECAVSDEEERIRGVLSRHVEAAAGDVRQSVAAAVELDMRNAACALGLRHHATRPVLVPAPGPLRLEHARHPLIVFADKHCVANDIVIDASRIVVVSGPNAGGKTVALKTAGLAVLMARVGVPILAAEGSTVPFFRRIVTDIGDAQSLADDLSTFSGHISRLCRTLADGDESTLVLIDEIAVGTEPEQGAALAQAVLEQFSRQGLSGIVTTHYDRLKELAADHSGFANASVGFDLELMAPTFELKLGVPGSSGAFQVAEKQGLPRAVVARAEVLAGDERVSFERLSQEVASERKRVVQLTHELETARADAERAKARADVARRDARETEKKLRMGAHEGAVAALRDAREELERAKARLRRKGGEKVVEKASRTIDQVARVVTKQAPAPETPSGVVPAESELSPGASVFVTTLGARGTVIALEDRGRVRVQVGALKSSVRIDDLRLPEAGQATSTSTSTKRKAPSHFVAELPAEESSAGRREQMTLDLRGQRVDEAVEAVDRFIDRMLLEDADELWVVHGHGTGALRKAVRSHLRGHKLVANSRSGERGEGGDGVTVVTLS